MRRPKRMTNNRKGEDQCEGSHNKMKNEILETTLMLLDIKKGNIGSEASGRNRLLSVDIERRKQVSIRKVTISTWKEG